MKNKACLLLVACVVFLSGCRSNDTEEPALDPELVGFWASVIGSAIEERVKDDPPVMPPPLPKPTEDPQEDVELAGVDVWLHSKEVASWPVTTSLDARLNGGTLSLAYDKANVWPTMRQRAGDGGPMNANVWVIFDMDGKTYAGVWDYMRVGQQSKGKGQVRGTDGHLPDPASEWIPKPGDVLRFMMSGDVRGGERNVRERSSVSEPVIWK